MLLPDALLRYNPDAGKSPPDVVVLFLCVSDEKKDEFQRETATNRKMKALMESILDGWPEDKYSVPKPLREH